MKDKILLILGIFCIIFPTEQGFSQEVRFGGFADTFHSAQIFKPAFNSDGSEGENLNRKFLDSRTRAQFELQAYNDNVSMFCSVGASYDAVCKSRSEFYVKEAYIDFGNDWASLRTGKQIIIWGKADGVQIVDIICPQDNTTLAGSNIKDKRIAVDAALLNLHSEMFSLDLVAVPVFTPAKMPVKRDNPLHYIMFPCESDGTPLVWDKPKKVDFTLENMQGGARLSAWLPFADFAASCYSGLDHNAVYTIKRTESNVIMSGEYKRLWMAGFETAIPAGPFVFRAESAFIAGRNFTGKKWKNQACEPVKSRQVSALAGFDLNLAGCTITAQYIEDVLIDYDEEKFERKQRLPKATLSFERAFLHDLLTLNFSGAINLNEKDCALCPYIEYAISDSLKVKGGADIYTKGTDAKSTYGKLKEASCGYVRLTYSF